MTGYRIFLETIFISFLLFASGVSAAEGADQKSVSNESGPRVVSLAPSNTELIYSLHAQDRLVGISSYCLYPPETKSKEKVGSFVSINWEKLTKLKPTVVVLVSGQEALDIQLRKHKIKTLLLQNKSLDDVAKNLMAIGSICACEQEAKTLAEGYRKAIGDLNLLFQNSRKSRVFFCVWPKPIVTVGGASFLNDVVNVCGGTNVVSNMTGSYPKCSPEKVIALQPDVLIMPHESRSVKLATTPPWSLLTAAKKDQVYFLPDREHDYLSRPTLRILKGLLPLCLKLHPEKKQELTEWGTKFVN